MNGRTCKQVQKLLNPYLLETGGNHHRVKLNGTLKVGFEDLQRVQYQTTDNAVNTDGPYKYCLGLIPTSRVENDYPVSVGAKRSGSSGQLTLNWDGAEIDWDPTGQNFPVALIVQGDWYVSGFNGGGFFNGGFTEYGDLLFRLGTANTQGWGGDRVVAMSGDRLFESPTATTAVFTNGMLKAQSSNLSISFIGKSNDYDDTAITHFYSWGWRRTGGLYFRGVHTGLRSYGIGPEISNAYFALLSGPDIIAGDPVNGAGLRFWEKCLNSDCDRAASNNRTSMYVHDNTIEGTTGGLLLAFGPVTGEFGNNHWETGHSRTHSILIGAGQCGGADGFSVCGSDSECVVGGLCETPHDFFRFKQMRFFGGGTASDQVNSLEYSGFYLGKGAVTGGSGTIYFHDIVIGRDKQADGEYYYFGFDPAATIALDFTRATPQIGRMLMPNYPYIVGAPSDGTP
jgi:hypothetical protein